MLDFIGAKDDKCCSVDEWLGCWICNQQVTCSNPGLPAVQCNPGQVVNTHVLPLPSSIIWYQPMDITGSPPTGSRPRRGGWAPVYALLVNFALPYLRMMEVVLTTGAIQTYKLPVRSSPPTNQHQLLQAGCPSCCLTNNVRALKGKSITLHRIVHPKLSWESSILVFQQ